MNIQKWMQRWMECVQNAFGTRVCFLGLQGSYARGEATQDSDIDVVVILDVLTTRDLETYRALLESLPYREKVCGFVAGLTELQHWDATDVFQFYYDTIPYMGDLAKILPPVKREDVQRAMHMGACNLYHGCCHAYLHNPHADTLRGLLKAAMFVLQAKYFYETETYISQKAAFLPILKGGDLEIVQMNLALKEGEVDVQSALGKLINWAGEIIVV